MYGNNATVYLNRLISNPETDPLCNINICEIMYLLKYDICRLSGQKSCTKLIKKSGTTQKNCCRHAKSYMKKKL